MNHVRKYNEINWSNLNQTYHIKKSLSNAMKKNTFVGSLTLFLISLFLPVKTFAASELCGNGINTAIGCIPVLNNDKGASFMGWILKWSVGVGSGIAFLLILYGGFMVMTSQANPERVKAGQELITSAVSGLILLVLSIFLLKFIGIDILGLNAFGFGQ